MNRGGNISPTAGFTIVETLIVLAVTSTLILSAMAAMSGRQARTEFQVGREAIVRDLQSLISKIESGRYEATNTFSCYKENVDWMGAYPRFNEPPVAGSQGQGTNEGCVFLGNALIFGRDSASYRTYVIAGAASEYGSPYAVNTIARSHPASPATSRSDKKFPNGFTYAGARYVNQDGSYTTALTATGLTAVRLMVDLQGNDYTSGKLAGSQRVVVHDSMQGSSLFNVLSDVWTIRDATPVEQPKKAFELCLASSGLDQSIVVTIGTGGSNKVSSTVMSGRTCGW